MAKAKKTSKKFKVNPNNFERNLMVVLLIVFLVSAGLLLARNTSNKKTEIIDSSSVQIQQPAKE